MTSNDRAGTRILGSLRSEDGTGIVRMEDRFDTDIRNLWLALTDPRRLGRWYGEIEGDLRPGGSYHRRVFASGAEGTGRIDVCEPPHRLLVRQSPGEHVIEVSLTPDGDQTILVFEHRGVPLDLLYAYGAGEQIHVEDLADYLAGRERRDAEERWGELEPAYRDLATDLS